MKTRDLLRRFHAYLLHTFGMVDEEGLRVVFDTDNDTWIEYRLVDGHLELVSYGTGPVPRRWR